ncbi:MAG: type II secretion system protein [Kiritimatiellae bacterium]|nr:type II secretion system protein [Kiritimatiellia bacterium]
MNRLGKARKQAQSAFTLIELLVVLAVIGILTAIAFTGVGLGLERGRRAACQNNLKQIGAGVIMYTDDHKGCLPVQTAAGGNPPYYTEQLKRYLPNAGVWACPKLPKWSPPNDSWKKGRQGTYLLTIAEGWGYGWPSYGPNANHVIVPDENFAKKASRIANPAKVYEFGEMLQLDWGNYPEYFILCPIEGGSVPKSYQIHGEENNVLFVDGHVLPVPESRMIEAPTAADDPWNHFGL